MSKYGHIVRIRFEYGTGGDFIGHIIRVYDGGKVMGIVACEDEATAKEIASLMDHMRDDMYVAQLEGCIAPPPQRKTEADALEDAGFHEEAKVTRELDDIFADAYERQEREHCQWLDAVANGEEDGAP